MIEVEHHAEAGYCIAWRDAKNWRVKYNAQYSDHGNDPKAAEAHARAEVAKRETWE